MNEVNMKTITKVHDFHTDYNPELINEASIDKVELTLEGEDFVKEQMFRDKVVLSSAQVPKGYFQVTQGFKIKSKYYCIIAKKSVYSRNESFDGYVAFVEIQVKEESKYNHTTGFSDHKRLFLREDKPNVIVCHENDLINRIAANIDSFEWVSCD